MDLKVDQLCQLANRLLEQHVRRQTTVSNSSSTPPVIMNRVRTGNHFRVHRRGPYLRSRPIASSPIRSATQPNLSEMHSTLSSSMLTDQSRESLVNLYYLFQDNLNSSKPDLV